MNNRDNLVFFDFEVNSLDEKEPVEVFFSYKDLKIQSFFSSYSPIVPEAQEVNHILNSDIIDFPKFEDSKELKILERLYGKGCIYVAHGLIFDLNILGRYLKIENFKTIPGICTQMVAKYYIENILKLKEDEMKSYRMQYLRYYFKLDEFYDLKGLVPHRAESDVIVLEALYDYLYKKFEEANIENIENLFIEITQDSMKIENHIIWFGKYRKQSLLSIYEKDPQYLVWLKNTSTDKELIPVITEFFSKYFDV